MRILLVVFLLLVSCTAVPPAITPVPTPVPRVEWVAVNEQINVRGIATANVSKALCDRSRRVMVNSHPVIDSAELLKLCYSASGILSTLED